MSRRFQFPPWGLDTATFRKLLVGVLLATILFLLPAPHDEAAPDLDGDGMPDEARLTEAGKNTLALFVVIIYFWATEALPLPVTALGAGVGLVLLRIVEHPNDAWGPYAQDTIFFLLGSLILADAVTKTGADRNLATRFLGRVGHSTHSMLFGIVAVSALAAMLISNHVVAAVMLPLVISILRTTGLIRHRPTAAAFILAIALGAGIAGLATPSGGSRNVIVLGFLDELYGIKVSYLDWTVHAAPITLALIPVVYVSLLWGFRVPNQRFEQDFHMDTEALTAPQKRTLWIMTFTIIGWIVWGTDVGLGTIAVVGAILMFVTNILDWQDTRKRVAWGVPLIYGAALAMGQVMQDTGAVQWLSEALFGLPIWGAGSFVLVMGTLILSITLTNIMSDGGTAAVLAPVTMALASIMGHSVLEIGILTAIGAAFGFFLVVANPGNVITYQSGLFTGRDLARVGLPVTVAAVVVTYLAVAFYWPLLGS